MIYIFEDQFTLALEPIVFTRPSFGIRSRPETFYEQLLSLKNLKLIGLMAIAPHLKKEKTRLY